METKALVDALRARGVVFRRIDNGVEVEGTLTADEAAHLRDSAATVVRLLDAERTATNPEAASEFPPQPAPPRSAAPDAEPKTMQDYLDGWRVEVRPGKPPRLLPPGDTRTFLALLARSNGGGSTWNPR